jgi:hypothetical protein
MFTISSAASVHAPGVPPLVELVLLDVELVELVELVEVLVEELLVVVPPVPLAVPPVPVVPPVPLVVVPVLVAPPVPLLDVVVDPVVVEPVVPPPVPVVVPPLLPQAISVATGRTRRIRAKRVEAMRRDQPSWRVGAGGPRASQARRAAEARIRRPPPSTEPSVPRCAIRPLTRGGAADTLARCSRRASPLHAREG